LRNQVWRHRGEARSASTPCDETTSPADARQALLVRRAWGADLFDGKQLAAALLVDGKQLAVGYRIEALAASALFLDRGFLLGRSGSVR
jgi:hypothetical protein